MTTEPKQPNCEECGSELACRNCNDTRPTATDLYAGWKLRTPLGTWETVKQTKQDDEYAPVMVWTEERPDFAWEYARWRKVDAVGPRATGLRGEPEVRFLDSDGDMSMHLIAGLNSVHYGWIIGASTEATLGMAVFAGRGKGWWIQAQQGDGTFDSKARASGLSKPQARTELKKIGRDLAKKLKVPFNVQPVRK